MKKLYRYINNEGGFNEIRPKEFVVVWLDKNGYVHQATHEPHNENIKDVVDFVKDLITLYKENFQSIKYVVQDNNDITDKIECKLKYNKYFKRYE